MPLIRNCPSCGRSNRIPARHLSDVGKCGACKVELPAIGEPLEVNEEQFNEIIRESKVPVLTDFWASWCGPCRMAAPHVTQTARDMAGRAIVLKVDTERYPGLASQYNVRSIPNFAVFSRGQLQFQQAGLVDGGTRTVKKLGHVEKACVPVGARLRRQLASTSLCGIKCGLPPLSR